MKKYVLLLILTILAGMTINCNTPVPPNSFRVKTRGKIHLFGIPLPFSIPNPGVSINLKTNALPGAGGTTGTVGEYAPGGQFVQTDSGGKFDAVNAILPALWTVRAAPGQSLCTTSPNVTFNAMVGGTYKLDCKWNVVVTFLVQPSYVDLTAGIGAGNPLTGVITKQAADRAIFANAQNLKVFYYRQVEGEEYVLEGEKVPNSVSPDGISVEIPLPDYFSNHGLVHYRFLIAEDGANEAYLGHGEFDAMYPAEPCPPRHCPIGKHWDSDFCYCVED